MNRLNRLAMVVLLAQPLVVAAGAAFAFSLVSGDSAAGLAVAEAQLDQFAKPRPPSPTKGAVLLRQDWIPESAGESATLRHPAGRYH
jgi:hypothetical protein